MSDIYPKELPENIISDPQRRAEVIVFNKLKNAKLYSSTKVYYSVEWLNTVNNRDAQWDGECDFIITDPDLGIIYIEVKGGHITKDDNGQWFSNNTKIKNPIDQVKKTKHNVTNEFLGRLRKKYSKKDVRFFYGHFVLFPNSSNQTIGDLGIAATKDIFGFLEDVERIERTITNFFDYRPQGTGHLKYDPLDKDGQEIFHDMFTKAYDFRPALRDKIKQNSFEIDNLTAQQEQILKNSVGEWNRLWIEGPAGSGKTSVAIEKYIQDSSSASNPVFICRGKNLATKIKFKINLNANICTFDKLLLDISNQYFEETKKSYIKSELSRGYTEKLRKYLIDQIFDAADIIKKYDFIIIDESQDFESSWWTLIEAISSAKALIWIFGDSNQKIWKVSRPDIADIYQSYKLQSVLRNSEQIANKSIMFYDGQGHGISIKGPFSSDVEIVESANLIGSLENSLNKMISIESVKQNSITILAENTLHNKIENLSNERYTISSDINTKNTVYLSNIMNFKGLESECIFLILEDLDKYNDKDLYIGISRAISYLMIITPDNCYEVLLNRLGESI